VPKLAGLGIVGCPGLSRLAAGMVSVEISRGDGSVNTFLGVQSGLAMGTINLLGSEDQKQRWLPSMATLEKIGAFALTEPNHGSDSVGLETSVRRDGDAWVLNGAKRWIGNASIADVIVVWAPHRRREGQGDRRREERRRHLPRRLHDRADHRQDRQAGRLAAGRDAARRPGPDGEQAGRCGVVP
jgi:alkylation response protein AidB-like acyl-CoA dehydrogenase